jgi:hypothetical protein
MRRPSFSTAVNGAFTVVGLAVSNCDGGWDNSS